jgi:hypothetical protein
MVVAAVGLAILAALSAHRCLRSSPSGSNRQFLAAATVTLAYLTLLPGLLLLLIWIGAGIGALQ